MRHLWLALAWIAWCALHSALIATPLTDCLRRRLGRAFRYYRLVYNLIAVATLVPVVLLSLRLDSPLVWRVPGPLFGVQLVLLAAAAWLFLAGGRHYDFRQFLGLRQIGSGDVASGLTRTGALDTRGLLGVTRHPWYLGAVLFLWSCPRDLTVARLLEKSLLTAYIVIGTILEERKLVREFGDDYRRYRRAVPMLVPRPVPWRQRGGRRWDGDEPS